MFIFMNEDSSVLCFQEIATHFNADENEMEKKLGISWGKNFKITLPNDILN